MARPSGHRCSPRFSQAVFTEEVSAGCASLSGELCHLKMPGQTHAFPSSTAPSGVPWDPREVGGSQEEGGDLWAYFRHKAISQYVP